MTQSCVPTPAPQRRRGHVVVLIIILVLSMFYSLLLLQLQVSPPLTISVLTAIAAITIRLCRALAHTSGRQGQGDR